MAINLIITHPATAAEPPTLRTQSPARQLASHDPDGPLLIALDGYLAGGNPRAAPSTDDDVRRIARTYRSNGIEALGGLEGSFVFCLVDRRAGRIVVMRDRLGGRKILYCQCNGRIYLASGLSDLIALSGTSFRENSEYLAGFFGLHGAQRPGETAALGVSELQPGEMLVIEQNQLRANRVPFRFDAQGTDLNDAEWIMAFRSTLDRAVETTLGCQGDVAGMLSGGLDSGPVSILAAERLTETGRQFRPISWFLPGFPDADEQRWIELLCQARNWPLQHFSGSQWLPFSNLETDQISPDSPNFNAFRPLLLNCYRLASTLKCRILINGHAGDRIYPHPALQLRDHWQRRNWSAAMELLARTWRRGGISGLMQAPPIRHVARRIWPDFRRTNASPTWLTRAARGHWPKQQNDWPPEANDHPIPEYARQLIGPGMSAGLAEENHFPARFGIERRDPYQNEALVRFMLTMPFGLSNRDGLPKWIMRQAMQDKMPRSLRLKPRTGRMSSFFDAGFNTHRGNIHDLLFNRNRAWQHYVKTEFIEQALNERDPSSQAKVIINRCIGHALWREYWENR